MRLKLLILCLFLQAIAIYAQVQTEPLPLNTKLNQSISLVLPKQHFEVQLTQILKEEELIVVVKGIQPYDDPEVRLAFILEDLVQSGKHIGKVYTCTSIGREICIIPEKDLLDLKKSDEPTKIFIEVTQRGTENKMDYEIQANYIQREEFQFATTFFNLMKNQQKNILGKTYQINQKLDIQEYTLKFNDTLKNDEVINRIFASLIPLNKDIVGDKVEFNAYIQENKSEEPEQIKGAEIWNFGLGININHTFTQNSKLFFVIASTPNQTYEFRTESPQHEGQMMIQEKYYGSLFAKESYTYKLSLQNIEKHQEKDLIFKIHPYFGKALIEINANKAFKESDTPDWSFEIWAEDRIVLQGQERVKINKEDETFYIRVTSLVQLSYSIRSSIIGLNDKLQIDVHDGVVGYNHKNKITNYLFKISPKESIEVRLLKFNIAGMNDIYIKQCNLLTLDVCEVNDDNIKLYEQEMQQNGKSEVFIVAKKQDNNKREFLQFYANPDKCKTKDNQECRYMIALKGIEDVQNKYQIRIATDQDHVQLKNNAPYKDKVLKFDFNFYKFKSPPVSNIKQIDFIVTTFIGHVIVRSSREHQFPKIREYELIARDQKPIFYNVDKYPDLKDKTFYISVCGDNDSIYTITPHITYLSEQTDADPGILIQEGIKQDITLSDDKPYQLFYIKVPYMVEYEGNPKLTLTIQPSTDPYKISMHTDQAALLKDQNKALFKNDAINNQVEISQKTFQTETILYGRVEPLKLFNGKNDIKKLTIYYNTEVSEVELEINKSSTQHFTKKVPNYYVFQIKEYSNYFISVITKAQQSQQLQFFVSLNQSQKRPTALANTGRFISYEGYDIDKSQIDEHCPFITEKSNIDQTCYVYLTGTSIQDTSCTIIISNEGQINYLYEGIHFKTKIPSFNHFSYFIHDVQPTIEHTSIQLISENSHLQIYALIYVQDENDQSTLIKKSHFPTSQNSQFQSSTGIMNTEISTLQIHTVDNQECMKNGCKILITVDNLDKKFIRNKDSTMNLIVTNPNTILELHEGKDYEIPRDLSEFKYYKYYVGENVNSLKVEILGIPKFIEEYTLETSNVLVITNNTSGLPIGMEEKYTDFTRNMLEIQPEKNQLYLKTGLYYIGVFLYYTETPVSLRLSINKNHIIFLTPDGRQREIFIDPQNPFYMVIDGINKSQGSEFLFLNQLSDFDITGFANTKKNLKITSKEEILDVTKDNQKVGSKQGSYIFSLPQPANGQHQFLIKITTKNHQTIKFIYRDYSSLTELQIGEYLKDIIVPQKYRVFYASKDNSVLKITLFSGEISIGVLTSANITEVDWRKNSTMLKKLEYSQSNLQKNIYEFKLQKRIKILDFHYVIIQNSHQTNDALYFIEMLNHSSKIHKTQVLKLNHPRYGYLKLEDNLQFAIESTAPVKGFYRLSIFFPSLYILENRGEKIQLPEVKITPSKNNTKVIITDSKSSSTQIYQELSLDPGLYFVNLTRVNDGLNLANVENEYKNLLEFSISLDTFGLQQLTDNVKYYQKSESKIQLGLFEYFRQDGIPFIVEVFDCLGETSLSISQSLETVKDFSSDLIVRSKSFGHYKYYTFSSFEEQDQFEKDKENFNENNDKEDEKEEFYIYPSTLFISSKTRQFDSQVKRSEFVIRVSNFEAKNQALMLPFEYFYLKQDKILVQEILINEGKAFKFSSANVRCENQCSHVRAKINYVTYELYIATTSSGLQEYSVCHTNMTNYKDLQISKFDETKNLLIRKALKSDGFAKKDDHQSVFTVSLKELQEKPQQIYYTIVATVNIQEFGSSKAQNIPIFYQQQKISGQWWERCIECEKMQEEKDFLDKDEKTIEDKSLEKEDSESTSVTFVIMMILLTGIVLMILYKVIAYCRNKGKYSLRNILSTSNYELNDYQQYDN